MFEFEIPDDYSSLAEGDLIECVGTARREFILLNDSDALDDETLDRMTALANAVEAIYGEIEERKETALALRRSYARQMKTTRFSSFISRFGVKEVTPEDDDVEEEAEDAAVGEEVVEAEAVEEAATASPGE